MNFDIKGDKLPTNVGGKKTKTLSGVEKVDKINVMFKTHTNLQNEQTIPLLTPLIVRTFYEL